MNPIEKLLAIEDIKSLKARYFRAVDLKEAELLRETFAEDVELDYRGSTTDPETGDDAVSNVTGEIIRGRDHCVRLIMEALPGIVSVHHASVPEIEIIDETAAHGIWPMVDRLKFPSGGEFREMVGYGHYRETYIKEGGKWRIQTLRLTRLRIDFTSA